jgi:hypothetical protein
MSRIPLSIIVLLAVLASACAAPAPVSPAPASAQAGDVSGPATDSGPPMPSASVLPDLNMPGTRSSPAGEYGWTGELGSRTGMHMVVEMAGGGYQQTQMVFAIEDDCFAGGEGPEPIAVTVAGLDGRYVEPYDGPGVLFMPERESGQITGGYALPIDDRTLCVYLTWDSTSTPEELDAARQVVESIRGQAFGANGIRIVFTLPEGWDIG